MGMESRDYYREWWRKRTGYTERARFRVPLGLDGRSTDNDWEKGGDYLNPNGGSVQVPPQGPPDLPGVNLHWSIKIILLLVALSAFLAIRSALK